MQRLVGATGWVGLAVVPEPPPTATRSSARLPGRSGAARRGRGRALRGSSTISTCCAPARPRPTASSTSPSSTTSSGSPTWPGPWRDRGRALDALAGQRRCRSPSGTAVAATGRGLDRRTTRALPDGPRATPSRRRAGSAGGGRAAVAAVVCGCRRPSTAPALSASCRRSVACGGAAGAAGHVGDAPTAGRPSTAQRATRAPAPARAQSFGACRRADCTRSARRACRRVRSRRRSGAGSASLTASIEADRGRRAAWLDRRLLLRSTSSSSQPARGARARLV